MSRQTNARALRKEIQRQLRGQQPLRVVPSRRGLVVTFLGVAAIAYATGLGALWAHGRYVEWRKTHAAELAR